VTVDHRQLGVDIFNEVWRLTRSREDDDRMIHAARVALPLGRGSGLQAGEPRPRGVVLGKDPEAQAYKKLAAEVPIAEADDREHLAEDLATL
jgi:hypothetical protein